MKKAITVDEYINQAPDKVKEKLTELRKIIQKAAPDAKEKISYGMPYYGYHGRLAYFAYTQKHIGLYIMPKVLDVFKDEVKEYISGRATLHLSFEKKLPINLIKKLILYGVKKNKETA